MKVEEDLVKALTDGNEHVLYSYNFCLFFLSFCSTLTHIFKSKRKNEDIFDCSVSPFSIFKEVWN